MPQLHKHFNVMRHFLGDTLKLVVLISLTLTACADKTKETKKSIQNTQVDTTKETSAKVAAPVNTDTLIVDRQTAVFYEPASSQIEKQKQERGQEDFYVGADDYIFYISTAREFLDSVKLTTLETKDKRFLKFISSDKTSEIIMLDTLSNLWGIYFFDPVKKSKQVDMTMIDEEYKSYFQ